MVHQRSLVFVFPLIYLLISALNLIIEKISQSLSYSSVTVQAAISIGLFPFWVSKQIKGFFEVVYFFFRYFSFLFFVQQTRCVRSFPLVTPLTPRSVMHTRLIRARCWFSRLRDITQNLNRNGTS